MNTEGTHETLPEKERLCKFFDTELVLFEGVRELMDLINHEIRLKTDRLIKQYYCPRNPTMQAIIDAEVEEMEKILWKGYYRAVT